MTKAIAAWQNWLRHERRAAENTIVSYENDLNGFFLFLSNHLGYLPGLGDDGRGGGGRSVESAIRDEVEQLTKVKAGGGGGDSSPTRGGDGSSTH